MKNPVLLLSLLCLSIFATAQQKKDKKLIHGMYIQWGYNVEAYTHSTIHFRMSNGDDFKIHKVKAHDRLDADAIPASPLEISIPQYNYRIGFYINPQHTHSLEINFDHAKYIVTNYQKVRVTGTIDKVRVDADSILNPATFLHFEHTDGANWFHINYVTLGTIAFNKAKTKRLFGYIWKAGAGLNVPRTDFTWRGDRLNNNFHVAGYNAGVEAGFRWYPFKKIFLETTGKTGYVRYVNALANTNTSKGNRASHSFGYLESITTIGFEFGKLPNWK